MPNEAADKGILELRRLHGLMDGALLRSYGWDDLAESAAKSGFCEFLLDYEEEEDSDQWLVASGQSGGASLTTNNQPLTTRRSRKKKPWRYRWPDDFRDEVLARLLELNEQRHKEEQLSGTAAEPKTKSKTKKKASKKKATKKKSPKRSTEDGPTESSQSKLF